MEVFQSTLPARGATATLYIGLNDKDISIHAPRTGSDIKIEIINNSMFISIHAPRTGSDKPGYIVPRNRYTISIHAPRTGSDRVPTLIWKPCDRFQSTLPARGAT